MVHKGLDHIINKILVIHFRLLPNYLALLNFCQIPFFLSNCRMVLVGWAPFPIHWTSFCLVDD